MKRYIRAVISLIYSFIKFCFIKIFHFRGFKFKALSLFSPFTEIELDRKSRLQLGRLVRAKSGTRIKVRDKGNVEIGDNTSFNHGCIVVSHDKISIGQDVQFGPNTLVYDHDHDFRAKDGLKNLIFKTSPIIIGNNVWIGGNVVILRGTKIGDNCVVGAGSVISGEFESNTVIVQKRENITRSYVLSGDYK